MLFVRASLFDYLDIENLVCFKMANVLIVLYSFSDKNKQNKNKSVGLRQNKTILFLTGPYSAWF